MKLNSLVFRLINKNNKIDSLQINQTFQYFDKLHSNFNILQEIPYINLNRQIQFNKNGLFLVAEEKNSIPFSFSKDKIIPYLTKSKLDLTLIFLFTAFYINNLIFLTNVSIIFYLGIYKRRHLNSIYEKLYKNKIKKFYLSKDLKNIVLVIGRENKYQIVDIKSFDILDEKEFEENKNNLSIPIRIKNNEIKFVPFNITIYDREIFNSIMRGVSIRLEEDEESWIHLDSENKII